jgi:putative aldouronate transport system substrate-binding protein
MMMPFLPATWRVVARAALGLTILGAVMPLTAHGAPRSSADPVNLTYYFGGAGAPADLSLVQNAINAITQKKINTTVTLTEVDWGTLNQKMSLIFSAGQPCDLVFTAPWINNYYQLVANGDLLPLDSLLKQYAPKTYASMPASAWNAAKVDGKIYAVINQQLFPKYFGIEIRSDIAAKLHINPSTLHSYDDVTAVLAKIKAAYPGVTPLYSNNQTGGNVFTAEANNFDPLVQAGSGVVAAVGMTDKGLKVIDPVETPQYMHDAELAYKWHQAGYTTKDPMQANDALAAFAAGKFAAVMDQQRPGPTEEAKLKATYGWDTVGVSFAVPTMTTAGVVATMTGICRSSAHPVQAMQFEELLNSDSQVYNLITHGIAGRDYVVTDKAHNVIGLPPGKTALTDGYWPNTDWEFGNQFNAYYTDKSQIGSWALQRKAQAAARPSVALGFAVNAVPINTQLAQLTSAWNQYGNPVEKGLVDPAVGVPAYIKALKAGGEDKVLAEVQKQINAWAKANHK